jgi:hypothetical protein
MDAHRILCTWRGDKFDICPRAPETLAPPLALWWILMFALALITLKITIMKTVYHLFETTVFSSQSTLRFWLYINTKLRVAIKIDFESMSVVFRSELVKESYRCCSFETY